jgi:DNA primase
MGLIPDDVIAEIRARADIVGVIGQHVQLKRAGRNWKGLCPFHGEKSPSFNVSPDKGFFYCFGCHKKGDVFTFVMEYQGKSFAEAAEALAQQCGVTIPEVQMTPEQLRARGERGQMLEVNKLATQFFREVLAGASGGPGRAYLQQRGTSDEIRDRFQLGYAPGDWHALADFLRSKRVDMEIAVKLGLVARQPRAGGFYDRFRERLVCPVVMPGGEIAGFSARLVADAPKDSPVGAKYINSPESAVYKKSRLLFGLAPARDDMRKKNRAVLVEGNFDVISMHQAGFGETIAPLGTALTAEQVDLLRRLAPEVILFYDGDRAGRAATRAALELLVAAEVPVRIAWSPRGDGARLEGQDPDSLVRAGVDVAGMLDRARDGLEHYAFEVWSATRGSSDGRSRALEDVAKLVGKVANQTKRDVIAATLATAMELDVGVVQRAIQRATGQAAHTWSGARSAVGPGPGAHPHAPAGAPAGAGRGTGTVTGPEGPVPSDELELVALLSDHPSLLPTAQADGVYSLLTDARLRDMYSAALAGGSLVELAPERLPTNAVKVVLAGRYASISNPDSQLRAMVAGLRAAARKRRHRELERQLVEARRAGDAERISRLVHEVMNIQKQVD